MTPQNGAEILVIGGSGVVGRRTVQTLRKLYPQLPLAIGGRDLDKARTVAEQLGNARAVAVDFEHGRFGASGQRYRAVALFVKDERLATLRLAQEQGIPYVDVSTYSFELAPEIAFHAQRPKAAPITIASNWLAGSATLPALHFARAFRTLDAVRIAVVLDEQDMGGPAAYADYERLTRAGEAAQILDNGRLRWVRGAEAERTFRNVDGNTLTGRAYAALDTLSIAAATNAHSARFDLVFGESAHRRKGLPFSSEIVIELDGTLPDGTRVERRYELLHPEGQAPMTAVGVSAALERLLGLAGHTPAAPGLYFPHTLIEPTHMLERLQQFGTQLREGV